MFTFHLIHWNRNVADHWNSLRKTETKLPKRKIVSATLVTRTWWHLRIRRRQCWLHIISSALDGCATVLNQMTSFKMADEISGNLAALLVLIPALPLSAPPYLLRQHKPNRTCNDGGSNGFGGSAGHKASILVHWDMNKMDESLQTTFSNAFSWMRVALFSFKFSWISYLWI